MFIFSFLGWKLITSFHSFALSWERHWNNTKVGDSLFELFTIIWNNFLVWISRVGKLVGVSLGNRNDSISRNSGLMSNCV
jgi:hypothetical protein